MKFIQKCVAKQRKQVIKSAINMRNATISIWSEREDIVVSCSYKLNRVQFLSMLSIVRVCKKSWSK